MSEPFIGEIKIFAGNFAPRGWTFCDGQLLPIAQNTALFSILGTTYGGDGRTTFGMPNLRGRSPMHAGSGSGLTPRALGQRGGIENWTLTEAQLPAHSHAAAAASTNLVATTNEANTADPRANLLAAGAARASGYPTNVFNPVDPNVDMYVDSFGDDLGTMGGGQAHTNMPPYLTLNFIIALTGLYPSRA